METLSDEERARIETEIEETKVRIDNYSGMVRQLKNHVSLLKQKLRKKRKIPFRGFSKKKSSKKSVNVR